MFETMSPQEAEQKNVEKNLFRRLHTFADAIAYCVETSAFGHQPVSIDAPEEDGLIAGFIRQKYDAGKKRTKKAPKSLNDTKTKNDETNL